MSRFGWAEQLVDRTPEGARPQPWDCSLLWGENKHRASLVWCDPQACKALKLRQRSSALTFHPQYETFLRECGLYSVVSLLGQTPCKELVTALLERWRPETNTFHLLQGEATITLEDVEVLTGLPTRGRPVSVGYDARAAVVICQELLGATPPPTSVQDWGAMFAEYSRLWEQRGTHLATGEITPDAVSHHFHDEYDEWYRKRTRLAISHDGAQFQGMVRVPILYQYDPR
ncbi:Protein MAIN-LIKE 2 [Linum perenne]